MGITRLLKVNSKLLWLVVLGSVASSTCTAFAVLPDSKEAVPATQSQNAAGLSDQSLLENTADVAMSERHYELAIRTYEQVERKSAGAWNKLGVAYEHMGLYQKARSSYEQAIKLDRKLGDAYNNLGTVFYVQHNAKQAERYYKKAIKLNPNSASAFENLGTSYFNRHKYHQGSEAYQDAFRIDPGIFTRSAIFGVKSVDDKSEIANISFFLAELYAQNGMKELALTYLIKAVNQGFHDEARIQNDKELASVREMPGFTVLMKTDKGPRPE